MKTIKLSIELSKAVVIYLLTGKYLISNDVL